MKSIIEYSEMIARQIRAQATQTAAVIELLDEGNTVPFIARYRKERTGSLDDEQIHQTKTMLEHLRNLDDRRAVILASIEEQGKLTDQLRAQIEKAETISELEDLYQPYRPKRRTRAMIAREHGL